MDPNDLLLTAARATVVYFFVLVVVRLLGKREIGNITAIDFIVALMLGEVVDEIIFGDVTLLKGTVAIGIIAFWHTANAWASYKSELVDHLTQDQAITLVEHGQIKRDALAKERLNDEELWSMLRLQSIEKLSDVKTAILEPSGQLSVIKEDWARELRKGDLLSAPRDRIT